MGLTREVVTFEDFEGGEVRDEGEEGGARGVNWWLVFEEGVAPVEFLDLVLILELGKRGNVDCEAADEGGEMRGARWERGSLALRNCRQKIS